MSNDNTETNVYERLYKLQAMVGKLVLDGKRDPKAVCDTLQTIVDSPILKFVTKNVFHPSGMLVPKKDFYVNMRSDAPVRIAKIDENFRRAFLSGDDTGGVRTATLTLRFSLLLSEAHDDIIIREFGGPIKAAVPLDVVYALLLRQSLGEKGLLRTDGMVNTIYCVQSPQTKMSVIRICWTPEGWSLVAAPRGYRGGGMVISLD